MSGELYKDEQITESERVCITQYEQKEYDSCSWENEDFGKELFQNSKCCGYHGWEMLAWHSVQSLGL